MSRLRRSSEFSVDPTKQGRSDGCHQSQVNNQLKENVIGNQWHEIEPVEDARAKKDTESKQGSGKEE